MTGRMISLATLLFLAAHGAGCASRITIATSPPGIEVFSEGKSLGKTPITVTSDVVGKEVAGGYLFKLKDPSFSTVWFWVPTAVRNFDGQINLEPFRLAKAGTKQVELARSNFDQLAVELLALQSGVLTGGKFDPERIKKIAAEHPGLGAAYFVAALEKIRSKDLPGAERDLEKAMALSPMEPDYAALKNSLPSEK